MISTTYLGNGTMDIVIGQEYVIIRDTEDRGDADDHIFYLKIYDRLGHKVMIQTFDQEMEECDRATLLKQVSGAFQQATTDPVTYIETHR